MTPAMRREIGKRLEAARIELGMNQVEMARWLGVARQHWNNWEKGRVGLPIERALRLYYLDKRLTLEWIYRPRATTSRPKVP